MKVCNVVRIALVGVALGLSVQPVYAQMPTWDPGGSDPAPPPPSREPAPIIVNVPGAGSSAQDTGSETPAGNGANGVIHYDGVGDDRRWSTESRGPVPEYHVVRKGDTLWYISEFYFNNPWEWPRVWSYNPSITSPHWIYPGNLVRLYEAGKAPKAETQTDPDLVAFRRTSSTPRYSATLRQLAFVDHERLRYSAAISGSVHAKSMLSQGDDVYLTYPSRKPPKVGKRYAIYTIKRTVKHPQTKRTVGSYVRIIGELEVVSVKKGKRARAIIQDSTDVIERGALVGPLKRTFRDIAPRRNERNVKGTVIAMLAPDQLMGEGHIVFTDLTKKDGLKVGNRLYVIRRGDAYASVMGPGHNTGQDDRRFPARAVAEVIVVQVGKRQSIGLISASVKEASVGDMVIMRKSK